jgi:hypothetical protein
MKIEELLEIEELKRLRVAYTYYYDSRNLEGLVDLFTEDAVCDYGQYRGQWNGRKEIRENFKHFMDLSVAADFDTMHIISNPLVTLLSSDTAHGRWYLTDCLTRQYPVTSLVTPGGHGNPLIWLGMYEDLYRKVGGIWKIERTKNHFFWPARDYSNSCIASVGAEVGRKK